MNKPNGEEGLEDYHLLQTTPSKNVPEGITKNWYDWDGIPALKIAESNGGISYWYYQPSGWYKFTGAVPENEALIISETEFNIMIRKPRILGQ